MLIPFPRAIGLFYFISEVTLSLVKRARSTSTDADSGSIRLLWTVIVASISGAVFVASVVPGADSPFLRNQMPWWAAICITGIVLRWWAIIHLGRFFTVNVAIASDHHVVDDGPYSLVRHPSYTGALMGFVGMGLSVGNWLAAVVMVAPVLVAFLHRMRIEEDALAAALGQPCRDYMARTTRLIPFVY